LSSSKTSQTVAARTSDDSDIGRTGDQHIIVGEPGVYKGATNTNLQTNEFGWEIDPAGFRTTCREITLATTFHLWLYNLFYLVQLTSLLVEQQK
jgi:beta-glucosidase/6-phospho-beta-glucosidase/beta-galactosidase